MKIFPHRLDTKIQLYNHELVPIQVFLSKWVEWQLCSFFGTWFICICYKNSPPPLSVYLLLRVKWGICTSRNFTHCPINKCNPTGGQKSINEQKKQDIFIWYCMKSLWYVFLETMPTDKICTAYEFSLLEVQPILCCLPAPCTTAPKQPLLYLQDRTSSRVSPQGKGTSFPLPCVVVPKHLWVYSDLQQENHWCRFDWSMQGSYLWEGRQDSAVISAPVPSWAQTTPGSPFPIPVLPASCISLPRNNSLLPGGNLPSLPLSGFPSGMETQYHWPPCWHLSHPGHQNVP